MHGNVTYHGGNEIRGVILSTEATTDAPLLRVPRRLWLTLSNFPVLTEVPLGSLNECAGVDTYTLKSAVAVALETASGAASFYSPYLEALPTFESYHAFHPRFASEVLLSEFAGLPAAAAVRSQRATDAVLRSCFNAWQGSESPELAVDGLRELSLDDLTLALARWRTRCYGIGNDEAALIPASDLLNTARANALNTIWRPTQEEFTLSVAMPVTANAELYDPYCAQCSNERLLAIWGVYLEDNTIPLEHSALLDCSKLREVTTAALLPEDSTSLTAPRCREAVLAADQGPLRCNFARLAHESCHRLWAAPAPSGAGDRAAVLLGEGARAELTAVEVAALYDQSAIHAVPAALLGNRREVE